MPVQSLDEITSNLFPELPSALPDSGTKDGIRATRRAAQWRAGLTQAWGYARQRARSDAEAEAIDAEFERQLAAGPDFARYHGNAGFTDAPKFSIDRNLAARLMVLARAIERNSFAVREKGKHGGALGRGALRLLETLLFVVRPYHGRLCPAYDTLADLALMSRRSVITAIGVLERMGFITVHRRLKRIKTALGFTTVQDTNAYEIHPPRGFFGAITLRLFGAKSECKSFSPKETSIYKSNATPPWGIPDGVFVGTG